MNTPRVALSIGLNGNLAKGTVLIDTRLFWQRPERVMERLGLRHGEIRFYTRDERNPDADVLVTPIAMSDWLAWCDYLVGEMRGGRDADLPLLRPGVVQHVVETQPAYVDPGRNLPPEEQRFTTPDYKLFILHSKAVFLDFTL